MVLAVREPCGHDTGLCLDLLSFLATVCPLPCLFPLHVLHSPLQTEMQARVCGETGSLASVMEKEVALESHPLPCLSSALRGSSTLVVSIAWGQGPQPAGLSRWLLELEAGKRSVCPLQVPWARRGPHAAL